MQLKRNIGSYRVLKTIGHGTFSEVVLAANKGELYAIKTIDRKTITDSNEAAFENEIRIHQKMRHQNITELIDLLVDENNYYLVLEYCSRGDLATFLVQNRACNEATVKEIARQVLSALEYIHSHNISHRDIKPENLLIDSLFNIKITDFGLSDFFGEDCLMSRSCGSVLFASPECLSYEPYNGKTTDLWSLGVTLFTLLTGSTPWHGNDERSVAEEIRTEEVRLPRWISPYCSDFISRLLIKDWRKRMTIEEAYKHSWLDENQTNNSLSYISKNRNCLYNESKLANSSIKPSERRSSHLTEEKLESFIKEIREVEKKRKIAVASTESVLDFVNVP
ncbi:CAMK family protein kinase [Tritrichomonas foetus]|uniref:CAMK family protein kinase n=1 Tax=Tritrichomonas foetus TaxID=1144522 RepID=A0A1J4KD82_9EUKA|nr:CAMK family protein kinase [Tritrichomonas foetus]|eukprot:OHT07676.1 CAMK family protein kinase [Tritrichomonas foetus]